MGQKVLEETNQGSETNVNMYVNSTQIHDFSEGVFQLFAKKMRETGSGEACEASFESI